MNTNDWNERPYFFPLAKSTVLIGVRFSQHEVRRLTCALVYVSPNPLVVLNCTNYIAISHSHFLLARRKLRETQNPSSPQRSHLVKRIWNLLPCRLGAIMTSNNISRQKAHSPHLSASCLVEQKAFKESLHLSRLAATVFTSSHDCHPASALSFSTVHLQVVFGARNK